MRNLLTILFVGILLSSTALAQSDSVTVSGRQILVGNAPYQIKGICYHPVSKGNTTRSFEHLPEDLMLMKEAGINTLRVYEPIDNKTVLDRIHAAGIKVIIGFGYNQGGIYDIKSGTFSDYVKKYKDHNAILMWELGNEYNYHPEWFKGNVANWYEAMNMAAEKIHQIDPNHPVSTAHGEVPNAQAIKASPNIDVWGVNVYRWDKSGDVFVEWQAFSSKPMYISETGGDSYMTITVDQYTQGKNEIAQAHALQHILSDVFKHNAIGSGVTVFSFTDGWWKAGNPESQDPGGWAPNSSGVPYDGTANEEYWGIVDLDRVPKKAYDVVKRAFTEQ